jgi:hypothetical protein
MYAVEGIIALFTLTALWLIKALYTPEPPEPDETTPLPPMAQITSVPIEDAGTEDLEASKFM